MLRSVGGLDYTEAEAVNLASDRIKHLEKANNMTECGRNVMVVC